MSDEEIDEAIKGLQRDVALILNMVRTIYAETPYGKAMNSLLQEHLRIGAAKAALASTPSSASPPPR